MTRQERLNQLIADYLHGEKTGARASRADLIAQHPDLSEDLEEFFAEHDRQRRLAEDVQAGARKIFDQPTIDSHDSGAAVDAPKIGAHVQYFGDYELLDEVARGGMGVVYKARQTSLKRIVALKMILSGQFANDQEIQRFHAEAEAAAKLDHPGIVPIFEVGQHEGHHYFSMAYVEGESLAHKVARGPLPPREAAEILKKTTEAIAFAHVAGVIHRDLKPANVLIDIDDQPRVTDFGLAKRIEGDSSLTATGQVLGTPSYIAPEQAEGKTDEIGTRSDIYSLGAVLYCLLTGRPPFQAATALDTVLQVLEKEPVTPRALNGKVPADLETICLKCLEKEPRRRYGSARELVEELQRYLRGEPIVARPIGRLARTWRWCRRNRAVAALSFTVIAMLASVAVVAGVGYLAADRERNIANRNLYVARMYLAHRAWESADVGTLDKVLDEYEDDSDQQRFRGWEWYYLRSLAHRAEVTLNWPTETPRLVAWSPDGERLAIAGPQKLGLVDAATGRQTLSLMRGHQDVTAVAWGPNAQLASTARDGSICIWDAVSGEIIRWIREPDGEVHALDWHLDDNVIATSGESALRLWNPDNGEEIRSWKMDTGRAAIELHFNPAADRLLSIHQRAIKDAIIVWDVESGDRIASYDRHDSATTAWSADGRQIEQIPKVWEADLRSNQLSLGEKRIGQVLGFDWNPKQRRLAVGSTDSTVDIFGVDSGKHEQRLRGHTSIVQKVAWRADGRRLASIGSDHKIQIWNPTTAAESLELRGHRGNVASVAWHPDGKQLVSLGQNDRALWVWDALHGRQLRHLGGPLVEVKTRDGEQQVPPAAHEGIATAVAWSPDGKYVVSAGWDETIKFWDPLTGQQLRALNGHSDRVDVLAWHPAENRLASGSRDGTVRIWIIADGVEQLELAAPTGNLQYTDDDGNLTQSRGRDDWNDVMSLAWSWDGRELACGARNGKVRVWDAETGEELYTLTGQKTSVSAIAWSPDGQRLAATSVDPRLLAGEIILWDSTVQEKLLTLKGHGEYINAIAWHPGGGRLASADRSGAVKIWDPASGNEILTLRDDGESVLSLAWSPDGRQLASAAQGGSVRIWNASLGEFADWYERKSPRDETHRFSLRHFGKPWSSDPRISGIVFGEGGNYDAASFNLVRAIELGANDGEIWHQLALVQLAKDDRDGYRRTCHKLLKRFGATQQPVMAHRLAWICTVDSTAVNDYAPILELAKTATSADPQSMSFAGTLGAVLYRSGNFDEAYNKLQETVAADKSGFSLPHQLFLAMTLQRLDRAAEASERLRAVAEIIEKFGPVDPNLAPGSKVNSACPWDRRLELGFLLAEAENEMKD